MTQRTLLGSRGYMAKERNFKTPFVPHIWLKHVFFFLQFCMLRGLNSFIRTVKPFIRAGGRGMKQGRTKKQRNLFIFACHRVFLYDRVRSL